MLVDLLIKLVASLCETASQLLVVTSDGILSFQFVNLGIKLRESGQDISYGENPVEKAHRAGASVELSLTASSVSQTSIHMAEAGAADQVTQFLRTVA